MKKRDLFTERGEAILRDRLRYRAALIRQPSEFMRDYYFRVTEELLQDDRYLKTMQAYRLYQLFPGSGIFKALMSNPIKNVSKTESYVTLGMGKIQPHGVVLSKPVCGLTQYCEPQVPDYEMTLRIHGPWFSLPLQDTALDFLEEETGYYISIQDHPSGKLHMGILNWKTGEKLGKIKVGMNLRRMIESGIDQIIDALEKKKENEDKDNI